MLISKKPVYIEKNNNNIVCEPSDCHSSCINVLLILISNEVKCPWRLYLSEIVEGILFIWDNTMEPPLHLSIKEETDRLIP